MPRQHACIQLRQLGCALYLPLVQCTCHSCTYATSPVGSLQRSCSCQVKGSVAYARYHAIEGLPACIMLSPALRMHVCAGGADSEEDAGEEYDSADEPLTEEEEDPQVRRSVQRN